MTNATPTRNLDSGLGNLISASVEAENKNINLRFAVLCAMKEAGFTQPEHCSPRSDSNPEGCSPVERQWLLDKCIAGLPEEAQAMLAKPKEAMPYKAMTSTKTKLEPTDQNWSYWNKQPASKLSKIAKQLDQVIWSKKIPVHDVNGQEIEGKFQEGWAWSKDVADGTGGQVKTPKSPKTKILESLAKIVAQCEKDESPDYDAAKVKKACNAIIKSL